ncbi:MAG: DUF6799 domain-containing protein [Bacteroidota bacterium]
MKRTIALLGVIFLAGNVMAQNLDSIPPVPPKKVPEPNWNQDSSTLNPKTPGDSSLGKWKQEPVDRTQDSTMSQKQDTTTSQKPEVKEKQPDRAVMKDGEMVIEKNGETTKMTENIVYPSGTVLKVDGTVKKKDGSEVKLKDGQFIALPDPADDKKKKTINKKKRVE